MTGTNKLGLIIFLIGLVGSFNTPSAEAKFVSWIIGMIGSAMFLYAERKDVTK
jgi:hypothetical protein